MTDLLDIINHVKPTVLIGLSTVKGAFSEAVIRRMASQTPRPVIFPLSNPVSLSECTFSEALHASGGSVLFASGSPFLPEDFGGRAWEPGQGNNMYIFPGMSTGILRCD
jgi:malate dehydrogenase (oxaloacetate-decarboxylating)(NADP+)